MLQHSSSRLDRSKPVDAKIAKLEAVITETSIEYAESLLANSSFFSFVRDSHRGPELMKYSFAQYKLFRDQLNRWFALCILKAPPTVADPEITKQVIGLADHIYADLNDGHDQLYLDMLEELGMTPDEITQIAPGKGTKDYISSFFVEFGYGDENFAETCAVLSGRELCVTVRNRFLIDNYFAKRKISVPKWVEIHAELEIEHFRDEIRPIIEMLINGHKGRMVTEDAVKHGIKMQIEYFETLFMEFRELTVAHI